MLLHSASQPASESDGNAQISGWSESGIGSDVTGAIHDSGSIARSPVSSRIVTASFTIVSKSSQEPHERVVKESLLRSIKTLQPNEPLPNWRRQLTHCPRAT